MCRFKNLVLMVLTVETVFDSEGNKLHYKDAQIYKYRLGGFFVSFSNHFHNAQKV